MTITTSMTTYTRDSRIKKIIQVCQEQTNYLIGFGKYTPWGEDDLPLMPSGLERTIAQLFHLQPITINPIVLADTSTEETDHTEITINQKTYHLIEPISEVLKETNCHLILCQTELIHQNLSQTSWRSTGIFHKTIETPAPSNSEEDVQFVSMSVDPDDYPTVHSDPPEGLQLIALVNHSVRTKETSAVETINLVLYCPDGF
jgi:hypothetical protein